MFYVLLILPLLHKLGNFSPGLYALDRLCSMPKHQAQTEKVKSFGSPSLCSPFSRWRPLYPPFQQMWFSENPGRWGGVETKKVTAEPANAFEE